MIVGIEFGRMKWVGFIVEQEMFGVQNTYPNGLLPGDHKKIGNAMEAPQFLPPVDHYNSETKADQNYPAKAKMLVQAHIVKSMREAGVLHEFPSFEVHIVWFSKILQNWKALIVMTPYVGRYYEVTHNGDKDETYIDVYEKIENVVITD